MSDISSLFANLALAQLLPALLILLIGIVVIRFAAQLVEKALKKTKLEKAAHSLIKSLIRTVLYLLLGLSYLLGH